MSEESVDNTIYLPAHLECPTNPGKFLKHDGKGGATICFRKNLTECYVNCSKKNGCGGEHTINLWKDNDEVMALADKMLQLKRKNLTKVSIEDDDDDDDTLDSISMSDAEDKGMTNLIITNEIPTAVVEITTTEVPSISIKPIQDIRALLENHLHNIYIANQFLADLFKRIADEAKSRPSNSVKEKLDKLKPHVWNKYNYGLTKTKCPVCNVRDIRNDSFSAGHIMPESKGGISDTCNLIPICQQCNQYMGTKHLYSYAWNMYHRVLWSTEDIRFLETKYLL